MVWSDLWTVDKARHLLAETVSKGELARERLSLDDAVDRIAAEEVRSPEAIPAFDRSTVDGYAIRAADTFGASEASPAEFSIAGSAQTGRPTEIDLGESSALRVSTGDMLPRGADAVVMLEYCERVGSDGLLVSRPVAPGENVAIEGEDFEKGELLFSRGHKIRPEDIAALAALGVTSVEVYKRPRVAVISTGNELVPPSVVPQSGKIRDSNSYALMAGLKSDGAEPVFVGTVGDDLGELVEALRSALQSDMVVISGGSSVGEHDLTPRAIDLLGKPGVVVHGLALKPGKPTIVGILDSKPVIGLPGNPVSARVAYLLLVRPTIRAMLRMNGQRSCREMVIARLRKRVSSPPGREEYLRVALEWADGEIWAVPVLGKSGSISSMVRADGLAIIPLQKDGVETGERVRVLLTGDRPVSAGVRPE